MKLRSAQPSDVAAVLALWELAAENAARPVDTAAAIEALIARDTHALRLAELDGVIVGTIIAGWDGWRFHLYRLAVHPQHRQRGIGGMLLADAQDRLMGLGAQRIDAMVLNDNELGQTIWAANGFTRQDEWSRWVKSV